MRVIRSQPAANFTQITNAVLRNHKLSHMARGVLAEMLSYPDGWSTSADGMWQKATRDRPDSGHGEGRRAYRAVFAELEQAGHLERRRLRHPDGRFETVLILHDEPVTPVAGQSPPTGVPEAAPRSQPPEIVHFPSSNRRTGYRPSESGTSTTSTLRQATPERGSTELSMVASRRAHATSCASGGVEIECTDEQKIAHVNEAAADSFGETADDEDALDIWARFVDERQTPEPVAHPVRYFKGIFKDFTSLDGVLSNTPERDIA